MIIQSISLAALVSGLFAIVFNYRNDVKLYTIFKPLTTTLIISIAAINYSQSQSSYSIILIISLLFALIGDVLLIEYKHFVYGLFSFLIAHIGFTVAFSSFYGFNWNIFPLGIFGIIGILYFLFLRKRLGKLTVPVAIYMSVIVIMTWQATSLLFIKPSKLFLIIAIASIFFSFSDAVIAYNKFKRRFKAAEFLILSTYWTAIYMFTIAAT